MVLPRSAFTTHLCQELSFCIPVYLDVISQTWCNKSEDVRCRGCWLEACDPRVGGKSGERVGLVARRGNSQPQSPNRQHLSRTFQAPSFPSGFFFAFLDKTINSFASPMKSLNGRLPRSGLRHFLDDGLRMRTLALGRCKRHFKDHGWH